jgi:ABC-type antimicrobial peptide transport system permease subunit
VRNLEEWIKGQPEWAQQHLIAFLFGGFAFLALVLAAVGLYSVVSYGVAQRTNELGIRMALGAQRGDVLRMIFLSTSFSVACGILAGAVLSLSLNRLVTSWAEGTSIHSSIFAGVTLLLVGVAAAACFVPARRASSIDPMKALRY